MSSAEIFTKACRALHGSSWQKQAAVSLGISRSSVVRYANGQREIPREVFEVLSEVIDQRLEQLDRLQAVVDKEAVQ